MFWADPISLEPVDEVPTKDGKKLTSRIPVERAKELDLLPRVSGILDDMLGANWNLQQYFKRTCILAADESAREPDEHEDDYIDRITALAAEDAKKARTRGTEVHRYIEAYLKTGKMPDDQAAADACCELRERLGDAQATGIVSEKVLGGYRKGYVGTPDIYVEQAIWDAFLDTETRPGRGRVLISIKTSAARELRSPYREHKYQQGAYAGLLPDSGKGGILFVQWYINPWTGESKWFVEEDEQRWIRAFAALFEAWREETGYDPRG